MPTFPSTAAFPASVLFPATATFPFGGLTLTNNQKLSLPANTQVGTRVQVTDRSNSFSGTFHGVFSDGDPYGGAAKADPTWAISVYASELNLSASWVEVLETDINIWLGGLDNPTPTQLATKVAELFNTVVGLTATSNGASFTVECTIEDFIPFATAAQGNYDAVFVLGSGIVQQLAVPSTDEVAAFPSGAGSTAAISIYVFDSNEGQFFPLGVSPGEAQFAIFKSLGIGWILFGPDLGPGNYYYTADEGYDFPWQPPLWTAEDGTPPAPNMMAVTAGQLVTGWKLGSVVYKANGAQSGRIKFTDVLAVAPDLTWDGMKWTDGTTNGSGNTAFPDIGTPDPVASEANWEVIP